MNILLFCDKYLPQIGGVELFVNHLAKNLYLRGHKIIIVASQNPTNLPSTETIDGIEVHRFRFDIPHGLVHIRDTLEKLKNLTEENNIDIINLHFVSSNGFYAYLLHNKSLTPLITSLHGNDIQLLPRKSVVQKAILTTTLRCSTIVTANSNALLNQAKEFYPRLNGIVIPSPIEIEDFTPSGTSLNYVFSMGRFEYKKGFDILIKSFQYIKDDKLTLVIAGEGPEFENCEKLIHKLNMSHRVRLIGYQSRDNIIKLHQECEIFVLPARKAPCDRTLLEAMSAGKPVIASYVDGVPEILRHGCGFTVPPEDPERIAEVINMLHNDEQLRRSIGKAGRLRVEKMCNWDRITNMYETLYQTIYNTKTS